ncbi:MAG: septicolysin [Herbinix sp.]|nr:septicolysin [Herbinix sp.]
MSALLRQVLRIGFSHYFGTDECYLCDHYAKLVKKGGQFGIVSPGLTRELTEGLPEQMQPLWEPNMYAWHSAKWWNNLWQRSGLVEVTYAQEIPDGRREVFYMKLAEALNLRADLKKRIAQLRSRLQSNAKVQEGDQPAENPYDLLKELDENILQLEELIRRINLTNCQTKQDNNTISDMIARKDSLALKNSILRDLLSEASNKVERYSNKEIRVLSTVKVTELQKEVDKIARELRELDTKLQGLNWTTDLL